MLALSLRVLLASVFIAFGAMKLLDIQSFVGNVENFQIPPFNSAGYSVWLAYFLVPLEILAGLSLLSGVWLRGGLLLCVMMTLSFMIGIGSVWSRGLNIECGCTGGDLSLGGYPTHMTVLAVMLGVGVYLMIDVLFPHDSDSLKRT